MMPQGFDIGEEFNGLQYAQEIQELEFKIEQLTHEIELLRGQEQSNNESEEKIKELRGLLQSGGVQKIAIGSISPNPNQPRKTFTEESIQILANSLKEDGQQEPIILIEQTPFLSFLLFDGERRWRAASILGWQVLDAVLIPEPDPKKLHRKVLVANLHREGLNNLDVAEALVQEIKLETGLSEAEIIASVRAAVQRLRRSSKIDDLLRLISEPQIVQVEALQELNLNKSEREIFCILLSLRLNPESVSTRTFRMLQFPQDLKNAIREKGISVAHALRISRLTSKALKVSEEESEKKRADCVEQIIREKLSVLQTEKLVSGWLPVKTPNKNNSITAVKAIAQIPVESLTKRERASLKKALQQKLNELEAL